MLTPTDTLPSTPVTTPRPETTPTALMLPTPSVTLAPFGECTSERILEIYGSFLQALNDGDIPALRAHLEFGAGVGTQAGWYAVVPREAELVTTGLFADRPEDFLDWATRRAALHERWNVLEFVQFSQDGESRVTVTAALLREADDFIAKPYLALIALDCRTGRILSVVAGAVGAGALPERSVELLEEALSQRTVRRPERVEPCPRSPWAFGDAVGEGPVYLSVGPDAVVNVPAQETEASLQVTASVAASERGPILLRLFLLPDETPVPFESEAAVFIEPGVPQRRAVSLSLGHLSPGCYVLQADGATWQQSIVFEVVGEALATLVPQLAAVSLPAGLRPVAAWRDGPETVRVGLVGPTLVARLSIGVGGPGVPDIGRDQRCERVGEQIPLCWIPHPVWGWPQAAAWDDSMRHYQLVVLAGNRDAWSLEDLRTLVRRLSLPGELPDASPLGGE
jgi:hypothetical protein